MNRSLVFFRHFVAQFRGCRDYNGAVHQPLPSFLWEVILAHPWINVRKQCSKQVDVTPLKSRSSGFAPGDWSGWVCRGFPIRRLLAAGVHVERAILGPGRLWASHSPVGNTASQYRPRMVKYYFPKGCKDKFGVPLRCGGGSLKNPGFAEAK